MIRSIAPGLVGALLLGMSFVVAPPVRAQGQGTLVLHRLDGPVHLDGLSDEPAWAAVAPFLPAQFEPENGARPTERTEFRVAYDDTYLYFSLRAYDSDPNGLRANTMYRDRLSGDDHFEILLDTFNDNETGVVFTTTPAGIRREGALTNDASGGGPGDWLNVDFNTYWDVAITTNGEGWFSEVRVPFSSLRFQETPDGRVVMGLSLQRKIARKTERVVFPAVPSVVNWAFLKPSMAQKVELRGIRSQRPVYVTPYALGGHGRSTALDTTAMAYRGVGDATYDVGGDLKYSLSNSLTLDLTVNTDFAQVEADEQQINLTRFSLFFPEKRQFFQERAGLFAFQTGGESRLFHSRRIGLTDAGTPVRLLGGARLVGRAGAWDLGLLNMQTAESGPLPSENFGVVRMRRPVLNAYSYAGGMLTSRIGLDGGYNVAYGLDAVLRLFGDDYLTFQWAYTYDDEPPALRATKALGGGHLTAVLERRRREAWGYRTVVTWDGPDYNPGIGFTQRADFTLLDQTLAFTWLPGARSALIWHTLGLRGFAYLRNEDGAVESAEVGPEWDMTAKSGTGASVEAKFVHEDLLVPFVLSDGAGVSPGRYTFFRVAAVYQESATRLFQVRPGIEAGGFYDGSQVTVSVSPRWYVSPHLELTGSYQYSRIRFPDRDQRFDAHLAGLRIGTAVNTKLSTNAFIQYNGARRSVSANVRFRYNFREGNDLWIVFNEGLNTDRARATPLLPRVDNRTILIKYTYTFLL